MTEQEALEVARKQIRAENAAYMREWRKRNPEKDRAIESVKARTIVYLRACEETGSFPSSLGLARSLGYSDRALRNWRNYKSDTETAQWLEMFNDLCADVLNQSALKNNANSIVSIFLNKAMYGFRETNELILTPNKPGYEEEAAYSAEDIRKRYMADVPAED